MIQKNERLAFLDFIRAIGAVLVLLSHLWTFWYRGGAGIQFPYLAIEKNIAGMGLVNIFPVTRRILFDMGKTGVALFFLMTGFLCNKSLDRQSPGKFLANKALRIYPVYIVGFSATFLCIYWYIAAQGGSFPYRFSNWLIQISLLREWFWMPNIDGLSWTIEAQLKFYLMIALMALFKKQKSAKCISITSGILTCAALLLSANMGKMYDAGLTFWWRFSSGSLLAIVCLTYMFLGTAFYQHYEGRWSSGKLTVVLALLFACFALSVMAYSPDAAEIILNYTYALGIFTAAYILSVDGHTTVFQCHVIRFLAEISYPMYVMHGLIGFMIMTALYEMGWNAYACFFTAIVTVIILSCLLHIVVEVPCGKYANRLLFGRKTGCDQR